MWLFSRKRKPTIVILGAGLAGLAAGLKLKEHNIPFKILEARDRIGGRVYTQTIDEEEDLKVELGGEWIGKGHTRMKQLVHNMGLHLRDHKLEMYLLYERKFYKPHQWDLSRTWQKKLNKITKSFVKDSLEKLMELDSVDLWHYLVTHHIPRRDLEITDLLESANYGESIRYVSSYDLFAHIHRDPESLETQDYFTIRGGNSLLPNALMKKIGKEKVKLKHVVNKISQGDEKVIIECKNGASFSADIVICTLPTYAITQIKWEPQIPQDQMEAISLLHYGRIIKSHVLFKERFWKDEDFEILTDQLPHFIYHATQNQKGSKGVLTAYVTGDKGFIYSQLTKQDQARSVCETLGEYFQNQEDKVEKVLSYYWGDDPYTRGAYAIYEPHQYLEFRAKLQRPHMNVRFAGEHLGQLQGFMEGAIESGESQVEDILKNL